MAGSTGLEPATSGLTEGRQVGTIGRHRLASDRIRPFSPPRSRDIGRWFPSPLNGSGQVLGKSRVSLGRVEPHGQTQATVSISPLIRLSTSLAGRCHRAVRVPAGHEGVTWSRLVAARSGPDGPSILSAIEMGGGHLTIRAHPGAPRSLRTARSRTSDENQFGLAIAHPLHVWRLRKRPVRVTVGAALSCGRG